MANFYKFAIVLIERVRMDIAQALGPERTIVVLCGSTRFKDAYERVLIQESVAGHIVLTVAGFPHADPTWLSDYTEKERDRIKHDLDILHLHKIRLAHEVIVINVGGYVGVSTSREIAWAYLLGKPIRWLEPVEDVDAYILVHVNRWSSHLLGVDAVYTGTV